MSSIEPHCCETKNCTGEKYRGWSLNCKFCHKKIFVECLRSKDELRTKNLLLLFGLLSKTPNIDGSSNWTIASDDPNRTAAFCQMFNVDSPFGITCDMCTNKYTQQQSLNVNSHETNGATIDKQSTSQASDNQRESMNLTQMLPAKITISPIVMPKEDENGLYSFYLSKADIEVTTDSIVTFIMENFKMSIEVFKVVALPSRRKNRKTYKAFKLTVFTREISEELCNRALWTSDYHVRPFEKVRNRKNKPDKQRTDKRQMKIKPHSNAEFSNKHHNGRNNNNNSNNNRSNANPRNNNNQRQVNNRQDRNSHRLPRNVRQTKGNRHPSYLQYNPVPSNGFHPQNHQLAQQQQQPMNFNYGQFPFWNAATYHYPPPQMYAHNLMPFQMNQQMYRPF